MLMKVSTCIAASSSGLLIDTPEDAILRFLGLFWGRFPRIHNLVNRNGTLAQKMFQKIAGTEKSSL